VAVFAWWTLLYEIVVAFDLPTRPVVVVWLVTAPLVAIPLMRANVRATQRAERTSATVPTHPRKLPVEHGRQRKLPVVAALACATASAALLATTTGNLFDVGCAIGLIAMAIIHRQIRSRVDCPPAGSGDSKPGPRLQLSTRRRPRDLIAALVAAGLAVVSMFLLRTSPDDVYYVNLSAWIAEHDHVPLRDTMFGPQLLPSTYGGGFPIRSIEAFSGALAGLLHVRAGTVSYLVIAPLCGFVSVWVLWQLARAWSRRRPLPVFTYSVLFVIGGTGGAYRSYSIDGVWQGKTMALAILMPLIWLYGTQLMRTRDRHWTLLLLLAGVTFVGLTSTAPLLGLVLAAAIALAATLTRSARVLGGGVALAVPVVVGGLAVALLSLRVGGTVPTAPTPWSALRVAYGPQPAELVLTLVALMLGALVVQDAQVALLIWCGTAVSLAVLLPGVLTFVNAATRSGPIDWRLLLGPSAPTLIGLGAAAVVTSTTRQFATRPRAARLVAAATAVSVVAAFAIVGTPVTASPRRFASRPTWKVDPAALADVRAILATDPSTAGPLLLPPADMSVLAMYTTHWFAVVPRGIYVSGLDEPTGATADRLALLNFVAGRGGVSSQAVGAALRRLHVTMVCLQPQAAAAARVVRMTGYSQFVPVGSLLCSTSHPA